MSFIGIEALLCLAAVVVPVQEESPIVQALHRADEASVRRLVTSDPSLPSGELKSERWPSHAVSGTPLHFAAERNLHDIVDALIELGADVSARNRMGRTPLHLVRTPVMVERLIAAGADPLAETSPGGAGPLATFAWHSRELGRATAKALIDSGSTLELEQAVQFGWPDEVARLLEGIEGVPSPDLLYAACASGDVEIVRALIAAACDIEGRSTQRPYEPGPDHALGCAIQSEAMDCAIALLEAGAKGPEVDALQDVDGWAYFREWRSAGVTSWCDGGDLLDRVIDLGDVEVARGLLALGFDPAACRGFERAVARRDSPFGQVERRLARAAWRGHDSLIDLLVEAGIDVDDDAHGATPLLIAAVAGHASAYERLLRLGARPSLHAAAALGRTAEVSSMLGSELAVSVDALDGRCKRTPLAWATHFGHTGAVEALLAAGADVNAVVGRITTRASLWAPAPDTRMPSFDDENAAFGSVLAIAVDAGHWTIAGSLVDAGALADASALSALCDRPGDEALHVLDRLLSVSAAPAGDARACEAVCRLLRAPAGTPRAVEMFERLVGAGMVTQLVDTGGRSILSAVWSQPHPAIAIGLRELGAPVDLGIAVKAGWLELVRTLDRESPATPVDRHGLMRSALQGDHAGVFETLLRGADGDYDVERHADEAASRSLAVFTFLEARGLAGYESVDDRGGTLLHRAASSPDFVRAWIERGLPVDARDEFDNTALHSASVSPESIRALLAAGHEVDARNARGDTPLLHLLTFRYAGAQAAEAIELLLESGADPLACGYLGPTAFELALTLDLPVAVHERIRESFAIRVPAEWLAE